MPANDLLAIARVLKTKSMDENKSTDIQILYHHLTVLYEEVEALKAKIADV